MDISALLGRSSSLFSDDIISVKQTLANIVAESRFLVIGGAGSIGQAVAKEIFKRDPKALHVVDISENNLVELVRELRSTIGYGRGDFQTFVVDCGSIEFESLIKTHGPYDYVFNLSALKHVRSESNAFSLMRMTTVNIVNTVKTVRLLKENGMKKYFCVSSDKATNPVNMMGASKRIMELFLIRESSQQNISMARFANVAFSDGSLLHGFRNRFLKKQPITAPNDILRYFITPQESGELCLLSGIIGGNREIFFPKLNEEFRLTSFSDIASKFLKMHGFDCFECGSEKDARTLMNDLFIKKKWPCYFFESDTTGEKDFEEFFTNSEQLDTCRFNAIGVIKNDLEYDAELLDNFLYDIENMRCGGHWTREQLVSLYQDLLPNFAHHDTGKFLDQRM